MGFEQLSFDRDERRITDATFAGESLVGASPGWEALDEAEREAIFDMLDRAIEAFGEDPRSASLWRITGRSEDGVVHYDLAKGGEVVRAWDGLSNDERAQAIMHLDEVLDEIHGILTRL